MKALLKISPALPLLLACIPSAYATNGMNLEGYGPESTAMGGSSMAFDNGTAAIMNNPATLMLQESENRLDLAIGMLGPDVKIKYGNMEASSSANAFFMPAMGYIHRNENMAYGIGVFGQGGMGTEFAEDSFLAMGSGQKVKSEVSVGRVIAPVAWKITDKLSLALTGDIVWAGMDIKMAMNGDQFTDLSTPGLMNTGVASGTLMNSMGPFMMAGYQLDYARFDFCDGSDFTGEAKGYGYAGKIGLLYEVSDQLSWGITYHSKTHLEDLDTNDASISMQLSNAMPPDSYPPVFPMTLSGKIQVKDFQWPSTYGTGIAYRPDNQWLFTADVKCIAWSKTMDSFHMLFTADNSATNDMSSMGGPDMRGQDLDAILFQNWEDQWVFGFGAAYQPSDQWTWRIGFNHGDNPVPAQYTHPLFPAIVETHITGGFSYQIDPKSTFNFSVVYGIEEEANTATENGTVVAMHGQLNFQVLYSRKW